MRIGLLTHSANPRGGPVHALAVAERLEAAGARASVVIPCLPGEMPFREATCGTIRMPARPSRTLAELVETRIEDFVRWCTAPGAPRFDVWHAGDSITANALADLVDRGAIAGFVRTVHHLDRLDDPRLAWRQARGIERAETLLCVSQEGRDALEAEFGRRATVVGNGVDLDRFGPVCCGREQSLAGRFGLLPRDRRPADAPILLALGGIEGRKNTVSLVRAFLEFHAAMPGARLVIAGGASLLDHRVARARFDAILAASDAAHAVILAGVIDDCDMPALYRLADVCVQVSLAEGFGLCPLEAMASGMPVVVSDRPPFTAHFRPDECIWADPEDVGAIAAALCRAVCGSLAGRLAASGPETAARFSWEAVAARHLAAYDRHLARARIAVDA